MKGRDFKAWAASLSDDCVIETLRDKYSRLGDWDALDPERIRATSYPAVQEPEPNALEGIPD